MCIIKITSTARILFINPYFSKSHGNFNDAIAKSLLNAGHHITTIRDSPQKLFHVNYTCISVNSRSRRLESNFAPVDRLLATSHSLDLVKHMINSSQDQCHKTLQSEEMQAIIKSKEKLFDLLIINLQPYSYECFLPIAEIFHIPVIGAIATRSWRHMEWFMGNTFNPAIIPYELSPYSYKMTFIQRLANFWNTFLDDALFNYYIEPRVEKVYEKHFPNSTYAGRPKPSVLFVNGHTLLTPRPMVPTIINIGGIHVQPEKPLPKNLEEFMNTAEHGVILFTMGSILQSQTMPTKLLTIFRDVFAQLPQRIIWKAEAEIEFLSENILLTEWLPQRDALAHKNLVAFLTHGGLSGIYEALHSGVPMLLTPTFFDQASNANIIQQLGLGICLDLKSVTKEVLLSALNDIINGTIYRQRAKKISTLIKDEPFSLERSVVFWTEYVLRYNGTKHLNTAAANMPLHQYLLLDVIGVICIIMLVFSIGLYYITKIVCTHCCIIWKRKSNISMEKEE